VQITPAMDRPGIPPDVLPATIPVVARTGQARRGGRSALPNRTYLGADAVRPPLPQCGLNYFEYEGLTIITGQQPFRTAPHGCPRVVVILEWLLELRPLPASRRGARARKCADSHETEPLGAQRKLSSSSSNIEAGEPLGRHTTCTVPRL
jgi:hypothetical protein